jgi:hypothetical protein
MRLYAEKRLIFGLMCSELVCRYPYYLIVISRFRKKSCLKDEV